MRLAPNVTSGILLAEIMFVCQRDKLVEWHGDKFFARTTGEWSAATGLSMDQVKRALASLRGAGLIEVEQHIFAGRCMNHVRPKECVTALSGESADALTGECGDALPSTLEEDEDEDETKSGRGIKGDKMDSKTTEGKGAMTADVAGIIKSNSEKAEKKFSPASLLMAMELAVESPTRPRLAKVFMISWVLAGIPLRPELTDTERRQLANLVDACNDTKVGVYLIAEMVEKWESLASYLKDTYKKSAPPAKPNIAYALAAKVNVLSWLIDQVTQDTTQALASDEDEGWGDNW